MPWHCVACVALWHGVALKCHAKLPQIANYQLDKISWPCGSYYTYQKIKKMDKNIVRELYQRGDRKRKIALFKVYSEWILMDTSLKFIRDRINKDLGFNLITETEIKYARHHFKSQVDKISKAPLVQNRIIPESINQVPFTEGVSWTDPDEVTKNQNSLKSKFSK